MNHVASAYQLRAPFAARHPCSGCTRLNGDNDKEGKGRASEENGVQRKVGRHDDLNSRVPDRRSAHNRELPVKRLDSILTAHNAELCSRQDQLVGQLG